MRSSSVQLTGCGNPAGSFTRTGIETSRTVSTAWCPTPPQLAHSPEQELRPDYEDVERNTGQVGPAGSFTRPGIETRVFDTLGVTTAQPSWLIHQNRN